jgi:hypothetical protein
MTTRVATAQSRGTSHIAAQELTSRLKDALGGASPKLILVFASTSQPLGEVTPPLGAAFPGAVVLGASTAGEFTEAGDVKDAVAVFALAGDFEIRAGMGVGLREDPERVVQEAVGMLPRRVGDYP